LIDASLMQLHVGVPTAQHRLKTVILRCVKYAEQKWIQNHPLKIRVRKIRGGGNYASKYGILGWLLFSSSWTTSRKRIRIWNFYHRLWSN